jgi:Na+-transporting NADH:ubiquinone oxidoreductase subunit F
VDRQLTPPRNYSLTGPEAHAARTRGLVEATWFRPDIAPERLAELMVRTSARATVDTAVWLALLASSALLAVYTLETWGAAWSVLAFAVYGALYAGAADARWHECGHGTAFKRAAPNDLVYVFASFLLLREPTVWRWSHARHHSDTIIVGRDAEIAYPRPPRIGLIVLNLFHLVTGPRALARMCRHAAGRIDPAVADYVPEDDHPRVIREARWFLGVLMITIATAVATTSWLPVLLVGLPSFYGAWLVVLFGTTQHAGLAEDVLDHRLNTRSVRMNPVFRFLYLNMNHHVEHHLFPTVPYHALPALQREIGSQLAPTIPSTWAAYREILPALWRQRRDPTHVIVPTLPADVFGHRAAPVRTPRATSGSDLEIGQVRAVEKDGQRFTLCRPTADEYVLTDGSCTHGDASLAEGLLQGWTLECPRHNGRFDLRTGEAVRRPATRPINVRALSAAEALGFEAPGNADGEAALDPSTR